MKRKIAKKVYMKRNYGKSEREENKLWSWFRGGLCYHRVIM